MHLTRRSSKRSARSLQRLTRYSPTHSSGNALPLYLSVDSLKIALASAAFYALFFFSMTQPLSALARQVRAADPTGDVNSPVRVSAVHKQNELGQIADATNDQVMHIRKYF